MAGTDACRRRWCQTYAQESSLGLGFGSRHRCLQTHIVPGVRADVVFLAWVLMPGIDACRRISCQACAQELHFGHMRAHEHKHGHTHGHTHNTHTHTLTRARKNTVGGEGPDGRRFLSSTRPFFFTGPSAVGATIFPPLYVAV